MSVFLYFFWDWINFSSLPDGLRQFLFEKFVYSSISHGNSEMTVSSYIYPRCIGATGISEIPWKTRDYKISAFKLSARACVGRQSDNQTLSSSKISLKACVNVVVVLFFRVLL